MLKALVSKPALILVALLGWSVAVALVSRGFSPSPKPPEIGAGSNILESSRTEPAPDTRKWEAEPKPAPPQIIVLSPGERDRAKIAREIGREDLGREFTAESIESARRLGVISEEDAKATQAAYAAEQERLARENHDLKGRIIQFERELVARRAIPPSPWGGTATATLNRVTGATDVDYVRKARPRVNALWDFGVGARYAWSDAEIQNFAAATPTTETASAYVFAEPVEFGRRFPTVVRLDFGWQRTFLADYEADGWYGSVAFEAHFNRDRRINQRREE